MQNLIQGLRELEADPSVVTGRFDFITSDKIESAACSLLITGDGRTNWNNVRVLKDHGYHVGPGEQDSFGWLTGVIYTSKGKLVYG